MWSMMKKDRITESERMQWRVSLLSAVSFRLKSYRAAEWRRRLALLTEALNRSNVSLHLIDQYQRD